MDGKRPRRPTGREFDILQVVWAKGRCSVRDIYTELKPTFNISYTGVLKLVQIMTAKGLLHKETARRPQVFTAAISQIMAERVLLRDVIDRHFGGSVSALCRRALTAQRHDPEELLRLRRWLDEKYSLAAKARRLDGADESNDGDANAHDADTHDADAHDADAPDRAASDRAASGARSRA